MRIVFRLCAVVVLSMYLAACSSGSSGGAPPAAAAPAPVVLTGIFTDSPVEGLSYSTATQSGVTDAAGAFLYIAGETITFSIGGTVIGEPVAATSAMTPRDLVPGAPLYTTTLEVRSALRDSDSAEIRAFNRFINIIVFLQSLDEDADPTNGITIPAGIAALLNGIQIDFDLDADEFPESNDLRSTTHQAVSMELLSTMKRLVLEDEGMEMVEWAIVGVVFAVAAAAFWGDLAGVVNLALDKIGTTTNP